MWAIVFFFVVYDVPADHPRISRAELDYLTAVIPHSTIEKVNKLLFLQRGRIACNAERCISHGNSVSLSVYHTVVPYPQE